MASTAAERRPLSSAAASDRGLRRENNEDRYLCDPSAGLFMVIDGVGGQAAGEKAAETALSMLRARLERETGAPDERLREAITLANNEVHRLGSSDPDLHGMACVLTVAMIRDGRLVAGHVGDTRLYLFESGRVQKLTHDHSPVGEREDAGELDEGEAMRHPRRNEIFRDVGSEPHNPSDAEFVEIVDRPFRDDSAILICSDGLSDMLTSPAIAAVVYGCAAEPEELVARLVEAANREGGKDNVTVVFAAGPRFAERARAYAGAVCEPSAPLDRRVAAAAVPGGRATRRLAIPGWALLFGGMTAGLLIGIGVAFLAVTQTNSVIEWVMDANRGDRWSRTWKVGYDEGVDFDSIQAAMVRARPGDTIRVGPGEYIAPIEVRPGVTLVSEKLREALIRPPAGGTPGAAVVVRGNGGTRTRLAGFRILGESARSLSIGIKVAGLDDGMRAGQAPPPAEVTAEIEDVEVVGATHAAVLFDDLSTGVLRAVSLHDNPGVAVIVARGASVELRHNAITANGKQAGKPRPAIELIDGGRAVLFGNIIAGNGEDQVAGLPATARADLLRDNILGVPAPPPAPRRVK